MQSTVKEITTNLTIAATALAMTTMTDITAARADATQAKELFKAMSDYLAAQKALSFDYDTTLEVVTTEGQKLALASSGTVTLNRPDKIRVTRAGGFMNVEMVFDGKTLSFLGKDANAYFQTEVPGTIDHLADVLRDKLHRPLPGGDLLMTDVNAGLMPEVVDVKDLGSGVIHGVECDHFAFRTKEVDWQIWIAQGNRPYPCRYVVTSKKVTGWPQYSMDITAWKTGAEVAADDFSFVAPAGAKKLERDELPDKDDLPAIFQTKLARGE
jgi:hypothetical protein